MGACEKFHIWAPGNYLTLFRDLGIDRSHLFPLLALPHSTSYITTTVISQLIWYETAKWLLGGLYIQCGYARPKKKNSYPRTECDSSSFHYATQNACFWLIYNSWIVYFWNFLLIFSRPWLTLGIWSPGKGNHRCKATIPKYSENNTPQSGKKKKWKENLEFIFKWMKMKS